MTICPICGGEIIVTLDVKENVKKKLWEEQGKTLRDEWFWAKRTFYTDEQNLAWLSGRLSLLQELKISKLEALRKLKGGL